jgi:putative transposase
MRPVREEVRGRAYSYFVSTQTYGRRSLFRVEKWARLMVDVLKHYDGSGYLIPAYVVMPDHLHVLLSPTETVEKSVQLIKGGFSFRAKRELGWNGEVRQPGFTDHRIRDSEDWQRHLEHIRLNPVEARLVEDSMLYDWMGFPNRDFPQGLKPRSVEVEDVRAEARTLHPSPAVVEQVHGAAKAAPFQSNDDPAFPSNGESGFQSNAKWEFQGNNESVIQSNDDSAVLLPMQTSKGE